MLQIPHSQLLFTHFLSTLSINTGASPPPPPPLWSPCLQDQVVSKIFLLFQLKSNLAIGLITLFFVDFGCWVFVVVVDYTWEWVLYSVFECIPIASHPQVLYLKLNLLSLTFPQTFAAPKNLM